MRGITDGNTRSLRTTDTLLKFNGGASIGHTLHIVHDGFPISTHAILGRHFLTNFKCSLDYDTWSCTWLLTINTPDETVEIPIKDSLDGATKVRSNKALKWHHCRFGGGKTGGGTGCNDS